MQRRRYERKVTKKRLVGKMKMRRKDKEDNMKLNEDQEQTPKKQ